MRLHLIYRENVGHAYYQQESTQSY